MTFGFPSAPGGAEGRLFLYLSVMIPHPKKPGVMLRDPEDFDDLRAAVRDAAVQGFQQAFPRSYGGLRLEMEDVGYEKLADYTPEQERKAWMEDGYLHDKLSGTLRLVDENTGDVIGTKRMSLMKVPWITPRGTIMHKGNDYTLAHQSRLDSGTFTRRANNGLLETHFNVAPGSGRTFRVSLDPQDAQYRLSVGSSNLHLYSVMKDLGVSDDELEGAWGKEILEANKPKYNPRALDSAYKQFVPEWQRTGPVDRATMANSVRESLDRVKVSAGISSVTLPDWKDGNVSPLKKVAASEDLLEFFKQAAAAPFDPDMTPLDVLEGRLDFDIDMRVSAQMFMGDMTKSAEAKNVEFLEEVVKHWKCPHCGEKIHEKGSYPKDHDIDSRVMIHGACGGEFLPPPMPEEAQAWLGLLRNKDAATAVEVREAPHVYDWDGVLIPRIPGDAKTYIHALGELERGTDIADELKGIPLDIVTARPSMFEPYIRDTANRLGLVISSLHHAEDKAPAVKSLGRPLLDDSPEVVEAVRQALGNDMAVLHKAAAVSFTKYASITDNADIWNPEDGNFHTAHVPDIWRQVEGREPREIDIEKVWVGSPDSPGFDESRVQSADTSFPIILDGYTEGDGFEGGLVDGRHRRIKLLREGQKKIKVIKLTDEDIKAILNTTKSASVKDLQSARKDTEQPKSHAQAEAGNYRKGMFRWNGLEVRIENPKGSTRKGLKPDGTIAWESKMHADYGYVVGTEAIDGDAVDVFIGPALKSEIVYVIDQVDGKGKFDEHKCVLGCRSEDEARRLYLRHYPRGWSGLKAITPLTSRQFKVWLKTHEVKKPLSGQVVKVASSDFVPDLDGEAMQEAYDAVYGKSGPRLAGMKQWPEKWMPPGSDRLGWISWYKGYLTGTRTDDDARQIGRWKSFKAKHVPKFKANPTPRAAYALRYWGIDPLKHIPRESREEFQKSMEEYRAKKNADWVRQKMANLTPGDLREIIVESGGSVESGESMHSMIVKVARGLGAYETEIAAL